MPYNTQNAALYVDLFLSSYQTREHIIFDVTDPNPWFKEWDEDWSFEAKCSGAPGPDKTTTRVMLRQIVRYIDRQIAQNIKKKEVCFRGLNTPQNIFYTFLGKYLWVFKCTLHTE